MGSSRSRLPGHDLTSCHGGTVSAPQSSNYFPKQYLQALSKIHLGGIAQASFVLGQLTYPDFASRVSM